VTAITTRDVIRLVLEQHPLKVFNGNVICDGCHLVLGFPEQHIGEVLADVLDPAYVPPTPKSEASREDPRESYTLWKSEAS
jgi:hypothetical protein